MASLVDSRVWRDQELGFLLDFSDSLVDAAQPSAGSDAMFAAMAAVEAGAIANPDEQRQVGHYWLRAPDTGPPGVAEQIRVTHEACVALAREIHAEGRLRTLLVLGIGGSALGPQLVADALSEPHDRLRPVFIDNTDPEGIARILGPLDLEETLTVCISKSGSTPEPRNALAEVEAAYARAGVGFPERAMAITGEGSLLWRAAGSWRARVPMWDWVGGRTSVTSAVGLLPMALQGIDTHEFLAGASAMDQRTRRWTVAENPAALLSEAWLQLGDGRGRRHQVILPYRDRLVLFSRYLQQLVMESIGKEFDLSGRPVRQGFTVYGNKGSTDQHAYVQQLRDGPDDYFATFVVTWDDGYYGAVDVEPGIDSGDYLQGLYLGTRRALAAKGHPSLTIAMERLDAFHLGALIALYERAVGFYASRIGVNAYHQPGVEAGKRAAAEVIALKAPLLAALSSEPAVASAIAERAGVTDVEGAWMVLTRLAANERGVATEVGPTRGDDRFWRQELG